MFTVNRIGERCWVWGGRLHRAPHPQHELRFGPGWSLHYRKAGKTWVNYKLFTNVTGRKHVWNFSVGRGVFGRSEDFRRMRETCPEVLRWVMDVANGETAEFPMADVEAVRWLTSLDRRPSLRGMAARRKRAFMLVYDEILAGARGGYGVGFGAAQVSLTAAMKREHGINPDFVRDAVDAMIALGVVKISPIGLVPTQGGKKILISFDIRTIGACNDFRL